MQNSANYRIINRKKYALVMVVLVSILAIGVWTGLDHLAEYVEQIEELIDTEPVEAAAAIKQLVRIFAIFSGTALSSIAILIIWNGLSGWRVESMPPKGSWILEGQRTWTGESAVRIAKFTITAGVLLVVLAVVSTWILWNLGDTIIDQI